MSGNIMTTIDRRTPPAPAPEVHARPALPSEIFRPLLAKYFRAKVRLLDQEPVDQLLSETEHGARFKRITCEQKKLRIVTEIPSWKQYSILTDKLECALSRRCSRRDVFKICGAMIGCFPNTGGVTDGYLDALAEALHEEAQALPAGPEITAAAAWRLSRAQRFVPTVAEACDALGKMRWEFFRARRQAEALADGLREARYELEDLGMIEAEGEHAF